MIHKMMMVVPQSLPKQQPASSSTHILGSPHNDIVVKKQDDRSSENQRQNMAATVDGRSLKISLFL